MINIKSIYKHKNWIESFCQSNLQRLRSFDPTLQNEDLVNSCIFNVWRHRHKFDKNRGSLENFIYWYSKQELFKICNKLRIESKKCHYIIEHKKTELKRRQ